jgi:hypothetical protein
MRSPITRATVSVGPPAANGTIMVTGRDGKDCARAPPVTAQIAKVASSVLIILEIGMDFLPTNAAAGRHRRPARSREPLPQAG